MKQEELKSTKAETWKKVKARPKQAAHWVKEQIEESARTAMSLKVTQLGQKYLRALYERPLKKRNILRRVPERLFRTGRQAELVLDLLDDFRSGRYTQVSWAAVAIMGGGLLYTVSPADVIPDGFPLIGSFDDAVVLSLTMRLVRGELRKYCEFRNLDPADYFGPYRRFDEDAPMVREKGRSLDPHAVDGRESSAGLGVMPSVAYAGHDA